jgi:hypothetical protein
MGAEAGGQLNGASKKIVMMLDRFPGGATDPNFDLVLAPLLLTSSQLTLNLSGAANRGRC